MDPAAGHKYASWAHAIVRQIMEGVLLVMPTGGPAAERVRFFAATTGYDEEVFFAEDLPGEFSAPGSSVGRSEILAAADVALFLAERDTGLAALVEAMAAGVPIAASNTPDVAECAPSGSAALLSPACDPRAASADLLRLIEDRALADRLATAARQRAEECFDPAASRRRLAEIRAKVGAA